MPINCHWLMFPNILFVYQLQFAFLILESVWCSSPACPIARHSGLCYYLSYPYDLYIFSKLLVEFKKKFVQLCFW